MTIYSIFNDLTWTDPLTHPSTHTPTKKTPSHGWGILHRFQIFKRNRNISIRSSIIAFLLIWGGTPHARAHVHVHARTCTHTRMHVKHDKHGCLHGGGHLQFSNMFIFVFCACACMHMHVHVSRDTPMPPDAPQPICPSPEPQGAQITKSL